MSFVDLFQNATIEERVTILEAQVVEIEENIADLDQDVNFLFDEQVIQDERLLNLETETEEIDEQLVIVDDDLESRFRKLIFFLTSSLRFSVIFWYGSYYHPQQ